MKDSAHKSIDFDGASESNNVPKEPLKTYYRMSTDSQTEGAKVIEELWRFLSAEERKQRGMYIEFQFPTLTEES